MSAGCGPRVGCAGSLRTVPAYATTRTTSGACCASWAGVANGHPDGRWSALRRRSGPGRKWYGRGLKKARRARRTIIFIDESGLSERPQRVRTWAPRGQTPGLQHHFNWKVLSVAAGITWWNFYFRLYPGAIRAPQVVEFLHHLLRHLPGKLLVIWDGLPQHRARLVTEFIRAPQGRLVIERLPGYAPELNPVEYIWGYWKQHELPTSARATSPSSAITPAVHWRGCGAGLLS
jgi:transposase